MKALGKHLIIEFYDCDHESVTDPKKVENIMISAAKAAKATIVSSSFHTFNPFGVSGVVVIAESHLAIHTWPEYNYASLDVYTCGEEVNPWDAFDYLKEHFNPKNVTAIEMRRGILSGVKDLKYK